MNRNNRDFVFDFVKLISINFIVVHHCGSFGLLGQGSIAQFFGQMWLFVDAFFVISGYLFWSKMRSVSSVNMLVLLKRYKVLLKYYVPFMLLAFAGKLVFTDASITFDVTYFFLFQNYLDPMPFYNISWFLCVLEQSIVVLFFLRYFDVSGKKNIAVLLGIIIAIFFVRFATVGNDTPRWSVFYRSALHHSDGIFVGALLFEIRSRYKLKFSSLKFSFSWLLLAAYVACFPNFSEYFYNMYSYSVSSLLFGVALLFSRGYDGPVLPWVSVATSYGLIIFLSHPIILQVMTAINTRVHLKIIPVVSLAAVWLFAFSLVFCVKMIQNKIVKGNHA